VISVFDTGFLHGASVFTTMLAHNGRPFRLDRHSHTATGAELTGAVERVLEANGLAEARIRITLSAGSVGMQVRPTTVVTAVEFRNEPRWYEQGLRVIVNSVRQYEGDPIAGVKTGCYLTRILARQAAAAVGADEALWFTTAGHLAEACFCNVFVVRDRTVHTPPLETPVLAGVVREAVIELCGKRKIPITVDEPIGRKIMAAYADLLETECPPQPPAAGR
jgi:branched-subunit amino acid aminotransferase/4-amino-4-deoxychorismate lyase